MTRSILCSLGVLLALGCSSEPPARQRPTGSGGSGGSSGSSGSGGAAGTASDDVCSPVGTGCGLQVNGGPTGSGSECLAVRENKDADRVQLRQTWTRLTKPVGSTLDIVYGNLLIRATLRLPGCTKKGVSGYMKLWDWDRSDADIAKQTLRIGWATWVDDPVQATKDGLCPVTLDYTDPVHGLTDTWHVEPVVAKRVAQDFDAAALRGTIPDGEGVFYYNETTGETHVYQPLTYVVLFDNDAKLIAVPVHESEERGKFNDAAAPNCMGAYRDEAMKPENDCFSSAQNDPPWGCADGSCPAGEGPVHVTGYFKTEEIEKVYTTILKATLCVTYQGQDNAIAAGWADPNAPVMSCSSSSKWDPTLPDDQGLPDGDWCSETNGPATSTCHDAFRSDAFSVYAAFPIRAGTCPTTAGAGG